MIFSLLGVLNPSEKCIWTNMRGVSSHMVKLGHPPMGEVWKWHLDNPVT